jgi:hypothetical protein
MRHVAVAFTLLAMATADFSLESPAPVEVRRGPLAATLAVAQSSDATAEVLLRVVVRNVTEESQPFLLERPGVEFYVRNGRGTVVHAPPPCPQTDACTSGRPELVTLAPGGELTIVERWRPRRGHLEPGTYSVAAKVRAYPGARTVVPGDVRFLVPFRLRTEVRVNQARRN